MRQPTVTSPLHALVDAVPVEALRSLVLTLLQNGAATAAPARATEVRKRRRGWPKGKPRGRRPSTRASGLGPHHEGLPPKARAAAAIAANPEKTNRAIAEEIGVSVQTVMRARAEAKAAAKAAAPVRRSKPTRKPSRPSTTKVAVDPKLVARRKREAERLRVKRAAAKQAKAAKTVTNGNGNGAAASASHTPTQAFWAHAEMLQPTGPWKAVAREFNVNPAQAKDCYRKATLPPALTAGMVEKFLEVRAG